jgi:hypothetical protein
MTQPPGTGERADFPDNWHDRLDSYLLAHRGHLAFSRAEDPGLSSFPKQCVIRIPRNQQKKRRFGNNLHPVEILPVRRHGAVQKFSLIFFTQLRAFS